jgi:hypothetical protein
MLFFKPNELIAFMTDDGNNNENACYLRTNVSSRNNIIKKHNPLPQREKGEITASKSREEKTRASCFVVFLCLLST